MLAHVGSTCWQMLAHVGTIPPLTRWVNRSPGGQCPIALPAHGSPRGWNQRLGLGYVEAQRLAEDGPVPPASGGWGGGAGWPQLVVRSTPGVCGKGCIEAEIWKSVSSKAGTGRSQGISFFANSAVCGGSGPNSSWQQAVSRKAIEGGSRASTMERHGAWSLGPDLWCRSSYSSCTSDGRLWDHHLASLCFGKLWCQRMARGCRKGKIQSCSYEISRFQWILWVCPTCRGHEPGRGCTSVGLWRCPWGRFKHYLVNSWPVLPISDSWRWGL